MKAEIIPFELQNLLYDPEPGRERLRKDVQRMQKRARACLARGDYVGGETLRRLADQFSRAARPQRQYRPGPLS